MAYVGVMGDLAGYSDGVSYDALYERVWLSQRASSRLEVR